MGKIDLRTQKQRERDALHQAIVGDFIQLRAQNSGASNHRMMCFIAEKRKMTAAGVRKVLIDNNVI